MANGVRKFLATIRAVTMLMLYVCAGIGSLPASAARDPTPGSETNAFAELDWAQMLPADDVPMHRSPSLRSMRSASMDDGGDPAAGLGLAAEMSAAPVDHSGSHRAEQFGSFKTVAALDGRRSSLPGFVVPLESDDKGQMTEFLFVPFFGACIHVPPPPPNQIIYVHLSRPMHTPELWDAYELRGTLHTHQFDAGVASAAYTMDEATLVPRASRE